MSVGASLNWSGPNVLPQRVGDSFDMTVLAPDDEEQEDGDGGGGGGGGNGAAGASRGPAAEVGRLRVFMAAMGPPTMTVGGGGGDAEAVLVEATPKEACSPLVDPPRPQRRQRPSGQSGEIGDDGDGDGFYAGKIVLVNRGGCYFTDKIRWAQEAGAAGVIVANNDINGFFKSKEAGQQGCFFVFFCVCIFFPLLHPPPPLPLFHSSRMTPA